MLWTTNTQKMTDESCRVQFQTWIMSWSVLKRTEVSWSSWNDLNNVLKRPEAAEAIWIITWSVLMCVLSITCTAGRLTKVFTYYGVGLGSYLGDHCLSGLDPTWSARGPEQIGTGHTTCLPSLNPERKVQL